MENNNKQENRRSFLKKAGTMIGVGIAMPVIGGLVTSCEQNEGVIPPKKLSVNLNSHPALLADGGVERFKITGANGGNEVIVYRKSASQFIILDSTCPHMGCTVDIPSNATSPAHCPCHGVDFNLSDGSVLDNPIKSSWPGSPLKKLVFDSFDAANNILYIQA